MIVPGSVNPLLLASAAAAGGLQVSRSLRFNGSVDNSYLNRTPASAGNRRTWTWSAWIKRSVFGSDQMIFTSRPTASPYALFYFTSSDYLQFSDDSFGYIRTASVFRDPSAWYHIVLTVDTTGATAADYLKIYVNNVRQAIGASSLPALNSQGQINTATAHSIGSPQPYANNEYFNGYLANIHHIDGQALTPASFAETDATTGQWIPKAFSGGSYGTNGFYLRFNDNSTTAALGTDSSGNGNTWTTNNLSVTAGAGNDSLVDSPTSYGTDTGVGNEVRGNYATWNPLISTSGPISNGNLEMVGANAWRNTKGTISVSTGKWYFEATYTGSQYGSGISNTVAGVGFAKTNVTTPNVDVNDSSLYGSILAFSQTGHVNNFNAPTSARSQIASGDVIGFALNYDAGTYTIYVNNTSTSSGSLNFTGELTPWTNAYYSGSYFILNAGQRAFAYTAPSGFKALCTANLPSTTITTSGSYTGNGVADGPFVFLNGVPTAMTIGGNAVTFGTHADKLSNGFKIRTTSTTYNQNASTYSYSITTTGDAFKYARAQSN